MLLKDQQSISITFAEFYFRQKRAKMLERGAKNNQIVSKIMRSVLYIKQPTHYEKKTYFDLKIENLQ